MTNNHKINNVQIRQKLTPQPQIPCRIYYISKDGIDLGGTPIGGKLPWTYNQRVARGILRAWARDLITRYDTAQVGAFLKQWEKDWSAIDEVNDTEPVVSDITNLRNILKQLRDNSAQRKMHFERDYNDRDATTMYHLSKEMVEAISYCLKRLAMRPQIELAFSDLPASKQDWDDICMWLFKRG